MPQKSVNIPQIYIHKLPPEVLAVIFDFARFGNHGPQGLINVATVCKGWQSIIYSHPRLWTFLDCAAHRPRLQLSFSKDVVEHLERWFGHSSDLPLSLKLTMDPFRPSPRELLPLTDFLVRCPRWRSLHLKFNLVSSLMVPDDWPWLQGLFNAAKALSDEKRSGCWQGLQELEIQGQNVQFGTDGPIFPLVDIAPNLQELKMTFRHVTDGKFLSQNFVNIQNLRRLELDAKMWWEGDTLPDFYFRILSQGIRLETLTIMDHRTDPATPSFEFSPSIPSFPISNIALRHLTLHDSPAIRWCIQNLDLPSLTSLTLSEPDHDNLIGEMHPPSLDLVVKQLILQSHCRLKDLRLENTSISDEQLSTLLRLVPTLENLELEFTSSNQLQSTDFLYRLLPLTPDEDVLPALRSFSYIVGAWHIPLTIVRLKKLFKTFVEDPRRWWPVHKTGRSSPATLPRQRYNRLEKAHLLLHRIDMTNSTIYSRGKRLCNMG